DMADPSARPEAGIPLGYRAQKLVGMKASLHQQFGASGSNDFDGFFRCGLAVGGVDQLKTRDVDTERICDGLYLVLGSYEKRLNETCFRRFDRTQERCVIAGMRDGCGKRFVALSRRDQPLIFLVLVDI